MSKDFKILLLILIITIILTFTAYKVMPILDAKTAFQKALNDYSNDIVSNAEKIFRLETNNFLSAQFTGTYSPGMEPAGDNVNAIYPYGWTSLQSFWDANPNYKPIGLKIYTENGTGIQKPFIQFPSVEAAIYTVCEKLNLNGDIPAAWFSTDPTLQASYQAKLDGIDASFTNA